MDESVEESLASLVRDAIRTRGTEAHPGDSPPSALASFDAVEPQPTPYIARAERILTRKGRGEF